MSKQSNRDRIVAAVKTALKHYSPKMVAIAGCVLGQSWTTPQITEMKVTSDGFVLAGNEDDIGLNTILGTRGELEANWERLIGDAGLSPADSVAARRMLARAIGAGTRRLDHRFNPDGWVAKVVDGKMQHRRTFGDGLFAVITEFPGTASPFFVEVASQYRVGKAYNAASDTLRGAKMLAANYAKNAPSKIRHNPHHTRRARDLRDLRKKIHERDVYAEWYAEQAAERSGEMSRFGDYRLGAHHQRSGANAHLRRLDSKIGRATRRLRPYQAKRRNPGLSNWAGGPEHIWVYPGGVRVRAGDVIRYRSYNGMGRTGPEYVPAEGKVHLIGPAGAVVGSKRGGMPVVVTDETFVALVRKPR